MALRSVGRFARILLLTLIAASSATAAAIAFTVQVIAVSDQETALSISRDLLRQGFPTYVVRSTGAQGDVYRVRVGAFANRSAALLYAESMPEVGGSRPVPALAEAIPEGIMPLAPRLLWHGSWENEDVRVMPWPGGVALRIQRGDPLRQALYLVFQDGEERRFEAWHAVPLASMPEAPRPPELEVPMIDLTRPMPPPDGAQPVPQEEPEAPVPTEEPEAPVPTEDPEAPESPEVPGAPEEPDASDEPGDTEPEEVEAPGEGEATDTPAPAADVASPSDEDAAPLELEQQEPELQEREPEASELEEDGPREPEPQEAGPREPEVREPEPVESEPVEPDPGDAGLPLQRLGLVVADPGDETPEVGLLLLRDRALWPPAWEGDPEETRQAFRDSLAALIARGLDLSEERIDALAYHPGGALPPSLVVLDLSDASARDAGWILAVGDTSAGMRPSGPPRLVPEDWSLPEWPATRVRRDTAPAAPLGGPDWLVAGDDGFMRLTSADGGSWRAGVGAPLWSDGRVVLSWDGERLLVYDFVAR